MIHKIARYKVKPELLAEAHAFIREFVAIVKEQEPGTLSYDAYQERKSFYFFHLMSFVDEQAEEAHRKSEHVKKLFAALYPICEEPPRFGDLKLLATNSDS